MCVCVELCPHPLGYHVLVEQVEVQVVAHRLVQWGRWGEVLGQRGDVGREVVQGVGLIEKQEHGRNGIRHLP